MATRGRIGLELSDGSILSVYHHWDSYPQWLGKTLVEHYNTYEDVADLIDGGDMSCCWTQDRWLEDSTRTAVEKFGPEYYSQRGENCPPRHDSSLGAYCNKENGEEYHYVFKPDNTWVCIDQHQYSQDHLDPEVVAIPA